MDDLPIGRVGAVGGRREAKRFKIVTNGLKTEAGYFVRLAQLAFDMIDPPEVRKGFSLDEMLATAKKFKESEAGYDDVCIVLDIDEHLDSKRSRQKLENFLDEARAVGVRVCLSNESFEVWLLAHVMNVPRTAGRRGKATTLALEKGLLSSLRHKEIVAESIDVQGVRRALTEVDRLRRTYGDDILRAKPMTDVDKIVRDVTLLE